MQTKKFSKVVVYGSLGLRPGISELLWAFRKKHTLEEFPVYLDDHPFQLLERVRQEQKNGMRTADVVLVPHYVTQRMKAQGLLGRHRSAEADGYPGRFVDVDRTWYAAGVTFMTMAYNSKLLSKKSLPAGLDDLSSDSWRGRLGTQSLTSSRVGNLGAQYISFLRGVVSDKKWNRFLEALAGQNRPKSYDCIDHLLQGLLEGGNRLALTVYSLAYFRERVAGSPVEPFEMEEAPRMLTFTCAGLLKNSVGNESAERFMDFLLGEEAQRIIGTIRGIAPTKPGIGTNYDFEVDYARRKDFHPNSEDLRRLPAALGKFRELGLP